MRYLSLAAAVVLCAAAARADDLVERLQAEWDSQRTAIKTAHIRARAFRSSEMEPLSHSQVQAVFNTFDLANRPDDLRKLVLALWKYKEFDFDPWDIVEVTIDGGRLRERTTTRLGVHDIVVDRGITAVGNSAANQVSILRTSDSKWVLRHLKDFRYIPQAGLTAPDRFPGFKLTIAERKGRRVHLKMAASPADYDVDAETGFVHAYRHYTDNYTILWEVLQFGAGELPSAIAHLGYKDGKLIQAHILVVEQAELNSELPPDAFILKAPNGVLIDDSRNPERKRAFRADADIPDVAAAFPLSGD